MNNYTRAIVLDLDETLIHSYCNDRVQMMILRPSIDKLIDKLQEVKKQNIDIVLCTTSRNAWVNKFFELKPVFKTIFDKVYTRDNEDEWRNFNIEKYPLEYNARCKNVNLEYLKPVTTFGYDQVLYIDDNKLEEVRLQILFGLTHGELNKDITFFSGFKFYRKSIIWEKMLDYYNGTSKNFKLNQKLEEYQKCEELNPGCDIMVLAINDFVSKIFKSGLSMLDETYFNEYEQYDKRLLELQQEIQQIIQNDETIKI